ncbi:MAG: membrane-bound lytic murein transglycosylase MltF [Rhodocyclaceae bacterium]|nr:membrane-bound lytic murein transglycosylase MltF [Rhodocyclaceae bacterium]
MLLLLLLALASGGCERAPRATLLDYRELGELRVAIRQDAVAYREGPDGKPEGFEHDLLVALGEHLGVPVKFEIFATSAATLRAVERGNVHLAAASLIPNAERRVRWSRGVRPVDYVLVGSSEGPAINNETELVGHRIGVRKGSVPARALESMQHRVPGIRMVFARIGGETELIERVASGELDFAAADRLSYQVMANYHPELRVAMPLNLKTETAWALAPDTADALAGTIDDFLATAHASGLIDRVSERYFGHVDRLDEQRVAAFLTRIQTRLPQYRDLFIEAGRRYGLDWRLIAAVAYQESQWDPTATSYTGVRGMMMLTYETASRLGIKDRLDPRQSIMGGARYLSLLRDELPEAIPEPDRSWMAVAAYNVGMGHLQGARAIARSLDKDHTSWKDMKAVLPLIARPAYAARLRSGRGRGGEAVIMTESVRNYYEILARFEAGDAPQESGPPDSVMPGLPGGLQGTSTSTPPM